MLGYGTGANACRTNGGGCVGLCASTNASPVYVFSGSADHSVRVWLAASGTCVYCLRAHAAGVTGLHVSGNRLISIAGAHTCTTTLILATHMHSWF